MSYGQFIDAASSAATPSSAQGTAAPVAAPETGPGPAFSRGLSPAARKKIVIVAVLFAALFWPNLRRLWDKTNPFWGEDNWSHATAIPLIGLYFLYINRDRLLNPPVPADPGRFAGLKCWILALCMLSWPLALVLELAREYFVTVSIACGALAVLLIPVCAGPRWRRMIRATQAVSATWFGCFVLLYGILLYVYAIYPGQNDFLKDFGMVVTLFGIVLALTSWGTMRTAWFPIAFLVCGIPWPGLLYSEIASPLQRLAANVAVRVLELTGVEASAGGTKIMIVGQAGVTRTLNVAEACAGLRSLMTFISVAATVAFLSQRPLWQKILVTLSAIPIAIFCNVVRVSGQGLLDHYVSQQLSESFAHQFVGWIMLIPAFLLILLMGWLLDRMFVEEVDRRHVSVAAVVRRGTTAVAAPIPSPGSKAALHAAKSGQGAVPPRSAPGPSVPTPGVPRSGPPRTNLPPRPPPPGASKREAV